jgi:catechol 2,3-dioxygenase-like lactoylglutathione lyase family enzyme
MKIIFNRLDHVQICIRIGEEAAARKFYTGILGLTEIEKPVQLRANGGLWYQAGDVQLHIGVEAQTNKSKRHPAFEIVAIDEVRNYLQERGIRIQEEIQLPGLTRFTFFDPFDNRIELLEYKTKTG